MFSLKTKIIIISLFLAIPFIASADYGGQKTSFFVDHNYDSLGREQLTATLLRISHSLYIYIDENWWSAQSADKQGEVKAALQDLEEEFENSIYPTLTGAFGSEWRPGIDKDSHITVLVHPLKQEAGGYTSTGDEYSRLQVSDSNQREMVYLNADYILSPLAKTFLAHEFTHLITFNQKEVKNGVSEDIWLNEGRAEYAPMLLGYNEPYENSNLQRRVRDFLQNPTDSLTEWKNEKTDYGVLNLFIQYLVEQYGVRVLGDSLVSKKTGIISLNEALAKQGAGEDFKQAFTNWTIAVFLNNCSVSQKYCYSNPNLRNLRVSPGINFLPLNSKTTLAVTASTKNWAGNWQKFIGGQGDLKVEFIGYPDVAFQVPYLEQDSAGNYGLGFFVLDSRQQGRIIVDGFGEKIISLMIMPSIQSKINGFTANDPAYSFFWSASTEEEKSNATSTADISSGDNIQSLLQKISFLEQQLNVLRDRLKNELSGPSSANGLPVSLSYNLKFGQSDTAVKLLQTWLAKDQQIYPEAKITGYFGSLTLSAVVRFQEKYRDEILAPFNLSRGTGFVGAATRAKLNSLYSN